MENHSNNLNNIGIPGRQGQDGNLNQLYWEPAGQNIQQFPNSGISSGFLLNDVSQSQHLHHQDMFMQEDPQTLFQNPSSCDNLCFNYQDQLNFFPPRDLIHDPISTTAASSSILPPYLETAPQSFTEAASSSWPRPTARTLSVVNPRVHVGNSSQLFSGGFEPTGVAAVVAGNMSAGASTEPPVPANDVKGKRIEIVKFVDGDAEIQDIGKPRTAKKIQIAQRRRTAEKRRKEKVNDRINALYGLTPDCKGSQSDKYDMVISYLLSVKQENDSLKQKIRSAHQMLRSVHQRLQYAETALALHRQSNSSGEALARNPENHPYG